jgi:hypothetical protein
MTQTAGALIGANVDRRTESAEFKLGTAFIGADQQVWTYCQASGSAVATGARTLNASTFLLTSAAGSHTADTAFAQNEYGWVRRTTSPL